MNLAGVSPRDRLRRRSVTVVGLVVAATIATVALPLWLPLVLLIDLVRAPRRRPLTRLALFGWVWSLTECAGVAAALGLWCFGRGRNHRDHYRLMRWWAGRLMGFMSRAMNINMAITGAESLDGGNAIVLCRHASLADSLVSAWVITQRGLWPRYVLKRELLLDPCLDIVGLRVPNTFVARGAADAAGDLAALRAMAVGIDERSVAVIFPEGTRASSAKRERAYELLRLRQPERLESVGSLQHLIPVRPAGTIALLEGAPTADVVLAWHTGFDGLDNFTGILRMLRTGGDPGRFVLRRVDRGDVPEDVTRWLDEQWAQMDDEIASVLGEVS